MQKKYLLFILILTSIKIFSQPVYLNIGGGIYQPFYHSTIEFTNDASAGNGGLSYFVEFTIDYGKNEFFIEPYLGYRYRYQFKPFDEHIRNNYPFLYESGNNISAGIKKTLKVGEADLSFLGGLSYDWGNYKIEYVENNIEEELQINGIEYQLGIQINFKLFENISPYFSFKYNFKESKEYKNSINRFNYEIKTSSDYQVYSLGISLDIINML